MKWNNMSVISVCLLNLIYQIGSGLAHKCFVCGPDSGKYEDVHELKRTFPDAEVPLCSKYSGKMREAFIRECPTTSKGCLTKIEVGGSIMRTCAPVKIDDCQIANAVTYCYCSSDKCNTPDRRLSDPAPPVIKRTDDFGRKSKKPHASLQTSPPDDEDNVEGSAGWPPFYYDNYYEDSYDLGYGDPGNGFQEGDTVDGEDPGDYSDTTDPPPFIQQELDRENELVNKNKKHRDKFDYKDDIVFDDDNKRKNQPGGGSGACGLWSSAVLLILSYALLSRL